ncbi:MAG: DNA-binding protein WhiA [Clostridia bacterium]|nr:DNA-binding protein WhiA [Clostridia bacterium]
MSFSRDVKDEVLNNLSENACCRQAFLSAIIMTTSEYSISNNRLTLNIKTQIQELYDVISELVMPYGLDVGMQREEESFLKLPRYRIIVSGATIKQLLLDCKVAYINEENCFDLKVGIDVEDIAEDCCKREFVKGAFIGSGSASGIDEEGKKSIDYHLEWVFYNDELATDFLSLLESLNINARKVKRKKLYVVYLQRFEHISDMLVILNANESMLKLNDEYAKRSIKNSVNRISNCENANITKMVESSLAQLEAINLINDTIGIESLSEDLANLCALRLANTEESLGELSKLAGISKSAVNYRLNKIMKIAKEIREE